MLDVLNSRLISLQGPHEFRRIIQRVFLHSGKEIFSIDGPNDRSADLILLNGRDIYVFQSKWKKNLDQSPSSSIVTELKESLYSYSARLSIGITNTFFSEKIKQTCKELSNIRLMDLTDLRDICSKKSFKNRLKTYPLRSYQKSALKKIIRGLKDKKKSLLYLATGLGKTKVASRVIRHYLRENSKIKILVLAHMNELIEQLQRSIWDEIDFRTQTQIIDGKNKPHNLNGITFASIYSILEYCEKGYEPDLIIIDECHHVGFDNTYSEIIKINKNVPLLGVTATPWRGDKYNIEDTFGPPSFSCGLTQGMQMEYLSPIDYKLFQDNINWDIIPELSEKKYSIRELNKKLFIPKRDSKILDELNQVWQNVPKPKCIVFCQSINHCKQLQKLMKRYVQWENAQVLHSKLSKFERVQALIDFKREKCDVLLAVDILNEGIDVPNVNIICFARVTHSRKIFVQQLGRGLRIFKNKKNVTVLDFVADIRRVAAITDLKSKLDEKDTEILKKNVNDITFTDVKAESFIQEWIKDISNLEEFEDEATLDFPKIY